MEPFGICAAVIADLFFGDPKVSLHPIRIIGKAIELYERFLNRNDAIFSKKASGFILAFGMPFATYVIVCYIIKIFGIFGDTFEIFAKVFFAYITLAIRDLYLSTKAIFDSFEDEELVREKLSMIVGRDTQNLKKEEVLRASLETLSENISDGIIAPLFYLFLGGPALAMAYKAINTLDSMVGYKDERYRDFGFFSAKFDDLANFIPARISGILIILSSFILGFNWKKSIVIFIRDRKNHPSPNSGHPEAAFAGALGVRLGGLNYYKGVPKILPYIGDNIFELKKEMIIKGHLIMFLSTFLFLLFLISFSFFCL